MWRHNKSTVLADQKRNVAIDSLLIHKAEVLLLATLTHNLLLIIGHKSFPPPLPKTGNIKLVLKPLTDLLKYLKYFVAENQEVGLWCKSSRQQLIGGGGSIWLEMYLSGSYVQRLQKKIS